MVKNPPYNAGDLGSTLDQETRFHKLQLRVLMPQGRSKITSAAMKSRKDPQLRPANCLLAAK